MPVACEGDASVGRTREESMRCADDREESVTLFVEGTEISIEGASLRCFVTSEFGGGKGAWEVVEAGLRLNANLALGVLCLESVSSNTLSCYEYDSEKMSQ